MCNFECCTYVDPQIYIYIYISVCRSKIRIIEPMDSSSMNISQDESFYGVFVETDEDVGGKWMILLLIIVFSLFSVNNFWQIVNDRHSKSIHSITRNTFCNQI